MIIILDLIKKNEFAPPHFFVEYFSHLGSRNNLSHCYIRYFTASKSMG